MKPTSRSKGGGCISIVLLINTEKLLTSSCLSTAMRLRLPARPNKNNGWTEKVVFDKGGANLAGLQNMNLLLLLHGWFWLTNVPQVTYLNHMIEKDHRFIKKLTRPMKSFKSFQSASTTLDGIEVAHMIRTRCFRTNGRHAFQQFASLAT